ALSTSVTVDNVVNAPQSNIMWQNPRSNSLSSSLDPMASSSINNHEKYVATSYEEDAEVANSFPNSSAISNTSSTIMKQPVLPFPTVPRPVTRTRQVM
ncbi:unnamed protein product, partial [Didymodactylos carnosus]